MKHFKIKICFLIFAAAIFISGALLTGYYSEYRIHISNSDIYAAEQILNSKNITLSNGAVPKNVKAIPLGAASGQFSSAEEISNLIFKDGYEHDGNTCFKDDIYVKLNPEISITSKNGAKQKLFKNVSSKNAVKKVKKTLSEYKLNISDTIMETYEYEGDLNVVVTRTYSGCPVFDNCLIFSISNSGIKSVKGLWFASEVQSQKRYMPKSPIDALISFSEDANNNGSTIESVTLGYRLNTDDEAAQNTELVPTWRIITSDGEIYYYNC